MGKPKQKVLTVAGVSISAVLDKDTDTEDSDSSNKNSKTDLIYHDIKSIKETVCVKMPNLNYMNKIALSRKFLTNSYIFERVNETYYEQIQKRPDRTDRLSLREWERQVKINRRHYRATLISKRSFKSIEEIKESLEAHGVRSDSDLSILPKQKSCTGRYCLLSKKFRDKLLQTGGGLDNQRLKDPTEIATNTQEEFDVEKTTNTQEEFDIEKTTNTQEEFDIEKTTNAQEEFDIEKTEDWQCRNWLPATQKDYFSPEFNEILSNTRLVGSTISVNEGSFGCHYRLTNIYLESLRTGVFTQNWRVVAKGIEGLCEESTAGLASNRHCIFWNAGFLSLLRFVKDSNDLKLKVKDFAIDFRNMFNLPGCYPRRLTVEIAIWLTQEGFFNDAILFINEIEAKLNSYNIYYNSIRFRKPFNPKRDLIDMIGGLIQAVFLYSAWKRDMTLYEEGEFDGQLEDLRSSGVTALSAFEGLLELSEACEADVTTFLDPLIQLTLEYRSVNQARDLLKDLVLKHYGNVFVEQAFLKFLRQHFPDEEDETAERLKLKEKLLFKKPSHWRNPGRSLAKYRSKKSEEIPQKVYFKKTPNPTFSW